MKTFDHLMVDIETLGSSNQAVITSIAAVQFNIETGDTGEEFHVHLKIDDQDGHIFDGDTILWWLCQSDEARNRLVSGIRNHGMSILAAMESFVRFFADNCHTDTMVWSRPPSFDLTIIKNGLDSLSYVTPWNFRNVRCVRTLASFAPEIVNKFKSGGVEHDALEDCHTQIKYTSEIWNKLKF